MAAGRLLPAVATIALRSDPTHGCWRGSAAAQWIATIAALLPIERLVEPDRADGVLDQLARKDDRRGVGAAKMVGHWLTFGPPMLIAVVPGSFRRAGWIPWAGAWSHWRLERSSGRAGRSHAALMPASPARAHGLGC
jgi:hypothetical protein